MKFNFYRKEKGMIIMNQLKTKEKVLTEWFIQHLKDIDNNIVNLIHQKTIYAQKMLENNICPTCYEKMKVEENNYMYGIKPCKICGRTDLW
jgi:hypothetical protein